MSANAPFRRSLADPLLALVAAAAALAVAMTILQLWTFDLHDPIDPSGDSLLHLTMVKAVSEEGWPLVTVRRLGAPGRLDFRDFPALDALNLLIVRVLSWFTKSPGLLINSLYLLTFPLTAAGSFLVARRLALSRSSSFFVAILYAVLPYHFFRGTAHLFLSAYYLVPPAVLLAYEVAGGADSLARRRGAVLGAVTCILLGSASPYYAYFASIVLAAAAISGSVARRSWKPLLFGAGAIVAIVATLAVQNAPAIAKQAREGDLNLSSRTAAETEIYGLKIAQLVLPIGEHRWSVFRNVKRRYNSAPLITENDFSTLGAVGTIGFLFLLLWLLFLKPRSPLLDRLSVLNAAALLAGTIGGFSTLFSLLVSAQFRSVNRISVFIAFLSLLAAGWLFDAVTRRWKPWLAAAAALLVSLAGTADQTNRLMRPREFDRHPMEAYVSRIESSLPRGAAVFQLPYLGFPERSILDLHDYEPFRPYQASRALRFSYGAAVGSHADLWQRWVTSQPVPEMVRTLALAGFDGVWVDRAGYADRGAQVEREIATTAGAIPFVSDDGRHSFIRLAEMRRRLARELGPGLLREAKRATGPLLVGFRNGFYGEEGTPPDVSHWSRDNGLIVIYNDSGAPREAELAMTVETSWQKPSRMRIRGPQWDEVVSLGKGAARVEHRLVLKPGMSTITLRTNAKPQSAPGDPRVFVFRLFGFSLRETGIAAARKAA